MKLALISTSLLASGLAVGSAFAAPAAPAPMTDISTIKTIDAKTHQLMLVDGKSFMLPAGWTLHAFRTGEKVKVLYHDRMGSMVVTGIRKV